MRAPIAVGPGRAVIAEPNRVRAEPEGGVTYPIQPGKIQAPALRDETLARMRLLDWLDLKIHSRVVFVIADAGYGKTTLLADFSRRTRLRTIWYRLDEEDRDWVGFLAHLVAAGREFDPEFAPRTAAILRSLEPGGPTREDAIETFLEELPSIAGDGAALIFDDFHLADEVPDIRQIAREIVARGPERLSIVFASRRPPSIPVSKLRSLGELAEIGIVDLRFSDSEMEQLFRETYGRPLEPDVLTELARRTEGWAASLTLVQAALRERTPAETRSFVRGLSGARDELHDYLAEEVVGDLPEVQQQFLMRTSILQRVTPELAQVATGLTSIEVQSMVMEAERLGMLGRRANRRSSEQRYHPLVREFLEDRLCREVGDAGVDVLHVAVAEWAEPSDWQTASHHFAASDRWLDLQRVLESHLETIVASGAFSAAAEYVRQFPERPQAAAIEVLLSRQASVVGDFERVEAHARKAIELEPQNDMAVASLIASKFLAGDAAGALQIARDLVKTARSSLMKTVAKATALLIDTSVDANVSEVVRFLQEFAERCRKEGLDHFEGVTLLNLSNLYRSQGRFDQAFNSSSAAIDILSSSSSGNEMASAQFARASIVAFRGDLTTARAKFAEAGAELRNASRSEWLVDFADVEALLGDESAARRMIEEVGGSTGYYNDLSQLIRVHLLLRRGDTEEAVLALESIASGFPSTNAAYQSRIQATKAMAMALAGDTRSVGQCRLAIDVAGRQDAYLWGELANLALAATSGQLPTAILSLPTHLQCVVSCAAELVMEHIADIGGDALRVVEEEAHLRPDRWLPSLRRVARETTSPGRLSAARVLDTVGTIDDVGFLRGVARGPKITGSDRRLGKALARRLAPRVTVEDLGRLRIRIGAMEIGSQDIRRKVLSLLCLLISRPNFSATREEVMEAMWPDMDPPAAFNSLNQSVYFLRRVFEPQYAEETSAGYVNQDSDVLWLDRDLVDSRSREISDLIGDYERVPGRALALSISERYVGRFALDFTYEAWATDFREWLHVAYLRVIETEVRDAIKSNKYLEGILMARRALEIDPRHDELELLLLRLLRNSGAHSAAAEQYARYATMLRQDLGIEAPSIDAL